MEAGGMNQAVMFSSASDEWATPQELFDRLNKIFRFNLDAAATLENAKCNEFYTKEENGLSRPWHGNVWLNPPYGRQIGAWVKKAYEEVTRGGRHRLFCYCLRGQIQHGITIIVKRASLFLCVGGSNSVAQRTPRRSRA
jgi:hypothetical protein